jgi:hypothetical protein
MLLELTFAIALFHECFPQGTQKKEKEIRMTSTLFGLTNILRLFTRYRLNRKLRVRTVHGLSRDYFTTCRPMILLFPQPNSPHLLAGNPARSLNSKMYRSSQESSWNDWSTR